MIRMAADSTLIMSVQPGTTSITINEESDSAYIALKAIPNQGEISNFSPWTKIRFTEVIDPDAKKSSIEYLNFYNASLNWEPTGYEDYYKGFRIAEVNDTGFAFISHLLSATTFQYNIETVPGMINSYYVIAITKTDRYNLTQPSSQRINMEVPVMKSPAGFKGKFQFVDGITIRLQWEPVASNNTWYSGYLVEKKTITDTIEYDWEELIRIEASFTSTYIDVEADTANIYKYSIRSVSYPPGLGYPEYSFPDTIIVD